MSITGSRLKSLRTKMNVSQADVANAIGISRTAYVKYETGASKPVRKLHELAKYFNVSADYLLGNDAASKASEPELAEDETKLVADYRWLDADGKNLVLNMIRRLRGVPVVNDVSKHNSDNGSNYGIVGGNFNSQVTIS